MSKSNIGEPFILATYTSTIRGNYIQRKPGVYATVSRKSSSDDHVTVAVQADGVHVLDVSSLHPVISHTMGPATFFACPPLTLRATSSTVSTTYAVIAASSELSSPEEGGRTLWVWKDDSSLRAKEKQEPKRSKIVLPPQQTAHAIFSSTELPGRIVVLSTTGNVSVIDADSLEVKCTSKTTESSSSSNATSVIQSFLISSSQCSFFNSQNGAVLIVASSGPPKTTQLRMWIIDQGDSILDKGGYTIPLETEQICSVSCSPSGCSTVLTVDGSWYSYQLSSSNEPEFFTSPPTQLSPPLALAGLSFLPTPNSLAPVNNRFSVSTLALTSSHVLLAGISSLSQEIVLLLWDLQFSVLLASNTHHMPSSLSSFPLHIQLILGPQTVTKTRTQVTGQALLIISSLPRKEENEKAGTEYKSTTKIFVVPYTVPSTSTVSAALGLGGASENWLRGSDEQYSSVKPTAAETSRAKLLSTIRSAVEGGQGQAATAAFMKWASQDIDPDPKPVDPPAPSRLQYNFVKELLDIVLLIRIQPKSNSTTSNGYSPEIVRYLLDNRVVCSAMIDAPGALLGALRARNDWNSIELAFGTVLDLKESEIIESLQFIISQHRRSAVQSSVSGIPSDDAMQIDAPTIASSATISLPTFLNLTITYPTSRAPLVSAVRKQLRDAEDLTVLLEILAKWLTRRATMDEKFFPGKKDLKKTEHGVWTVVGRTVETRKRKKLEEVPPLDKIIDFIQIILDASFPSLLQHKRAHQVLQRINAQLNPEIGFANMLECLRGPLEPFAIAQSKAISESQVPEKEKEKERQKMDWRQRKKRFDGDVGVYQLEELVL
ncbi:hypothetical protein BYT27DRAFT_7191996 [Phlegmacium glaucopus]|nr:hypothetical protein BYT27DRAFT_7191996 [Phlegmacium glaucopus]